MSGHEFNPDWTSPPGDTMIDVLRERSLSETDFAARMEMTPENARDLLEGQAEITPEVAQHLKQVLGGSFEFWMEREFQYQQGQENRP